MEKADITQNIKQAMEPLASLHVHRPIIKPMHSLLAFVQIRDSVLRQVYGEVRWLRTVHHLGTFFDLTFVSIYTLR